MVLVRYVRTTDSKNLITESKLCIFKIASKFYLFFASWKCVRCICITDSLCCIAESKQHYKATRPLFLKSSKI